MFFLFYHLLFLLPLYTYSHHFYCFNFSDLLFSSLLPSFHPTLLSLASIYLYLLFMFYHNLPLLSFILLIMPFLSCSSTSSAVNILIIPFLFLFYTTNSSIISCLPLDPLPCSVSRLPIQLPRWSQKLQGHTGNLHNKQCLHLANSTKWILS